MHPERSDCCWMQFLTTMRRCWLCFWKIERMDVQKVRRPEFSADWSDQRYTIMHAKFWLGNSSQTCRDSSQLRQHKHRSTINDNENTWWIKFQSETKCQTPLPCAVSGRPPEKHLRLKLIKACSHFQSLAVILKDTSNRIQFVLQLDNLAEAYLL